MSGSRLEGDGNSKGKGRRDGSDGGRRMSRSRESMQDLERKGRSRFREIARDSKRGSMREPERIWRSRSRERARDSKRESMRDSSAGDSKRGSLRESERTQRSRSRERARDSKRESMRESERTRRSSSRERARDSKRESMKESKQKRRSSSRDSKTEQKSGRRARSRSRGSMRDRDVNNRDRGRSLGPSDDGHQRGRWNDVDGGRRGRVEEVDNRSQKGRREDIRGTGVEQRKWSLSWESGRARTGGSRESLRERERRSGRETERSAGSKRPRGNGDDHPDRSSRYGKEYHGAQASKGNDIQNVNRCKDMDMERERSREGGYGNHHNDLDHDDRNCRNRHCKGEASQGEEVKERTSFSEVSPELSQPPPEWIPSKHKIFLSHSGCQKPFTEHLCEKLEAVQHYPFFDRRPDSLPKGVKFYSLIMQAAQKCQVAILVLSEEFFTKSKWPMMELNEFVKAQESQNKCLKILPLFYKISREEFNKKKNGKEWMAIWKSFQEKDKSIDLLEWEYAMSKIQGNNGIEYGGEIEGEAKFIKKVVKVVCNLPGIQPDVKRDVSHVQSKETLCEPILTKLKEVELSHIYKVQVVGLYGMGGVGKTTLSKVVCNQMFGDFVGKVCHVEFGSMESSNDLMKRVLRELTEASPRIFDVEYDKLVGILKDRMSRQKVFLVLDNIWDKHIEEVEKYMEAGYHDGSMVLLTSRSRDVLEKQLHIPSRHCMEMPKLDKKGAIDVFLHYCKHKELNMGIDSRNIVERCVEKCYFLKEERIIVEKEYQRIYHYHPLALKVLGMQLSSKRFEEWEYALERMKSNKFNMLKLKYEEHPIFSILRIGYDALGRQEQNIFLDLVLIWSSKGEDKFGCFFRRFEWEWLCKIHRMDEVDMEISVNTLQRKGLLENVCKFEKLDWSIHDLYVEFAEVEAQHGILSVRSYLIDKNGTGVPYELLKEPSGSCWSSLTRIVIKNSTVQSLKKANLHYCKNVEVLDLHCCDELEKVYVEGMINLKYIVITNCEKLQTLVGVDKLSELIILRCRECNNFKNLNLKEIPYDVGLERLQYLDVSRCTNLSSIGGIGHATALQHLDVSRCSKLKELPKDFVDLKQLQHLNVAACYDLLSIVGIGHATALQHLNAFSCHNLKELPKDFVGLKQLQHLNVSYCLTLPNIVGIGHVTALQHLNVQRCSKLKELPEDFVGLKQLQHLNVSWCWNLSSLVGIGHATALQHLNASGCPRLELLEDFVGLKQLQHLDISHCNNLSSIVGIGHATTLQHLNASGCFSLKELREDFVGLKQMQHLDISHCYSISSIVGIGHATALQYLNASGCFRLKELPEDFVGLKQLQHLDISHCKNLSSIVGIGHATALQHLDAYMCYSLEELPKDFVGLKQLHHLDVSHCENLSSIVGIGHATVLQHLDAHRCYSLEELPKDFVGLKQLQYLDVRHCENLSSIVGIGNAWGCDVCSSESEVDSEVDS